MTERFSLFNLRQVCNCFMAIITLEIEILDPVLNSMIKERNGCNISKVLANVFRSFLVSKSKKMGERR